MAATDRGSSPLIILGSARPDGNTGRAAHRLAKLLAGAEGNVIDLAALDIAPFDYGRSGNAAFETLVARMAEHQTLVFATPVYWYAMSGLLKTMFDRLSDLLVDHVRHPEARSLAGRSTWLLATGSDPALPIGFDVPFARTSAYMGWTWRGAHYVRVTGDILLDDTALVPIGAFADAVRGTYGTTVVNR